MINYEQTIAKARGGDSAALQALYDDTLNGVWYIVSRLVDRREDVEDLVQDTYVTALSHLDGLDQPQAFPKWLHRIATNTAANHLKKKRPVLFDTDEQEEQMLNSIPAVGEDFLPEEFACNQELRDTLMSAIAQLPEKQRMAIFLHYYEGTSVKELAETLNVGENTVKSRLNAGRAGIRKYLEKAGISGVTMTVLAVALRNDAAAHCVPAATQAALWTGVEGALSAGAAMGAAAAAGSAAAGGAATASATSASSVTSAVAALAGVVKTQVLSTLWGKIIAAVLAVAIVAGGVSIVSSTVNSGNPSGPANSYHSKYGIPEEMGLFNVLTEKDLSPVLPLLTHDFGEPTAIYTSDDGSFTVHYYPDGYGKVYISRDFIDRNPNLTKNYGITLLSEHREEVCFLDLHIGGFSFRSPSDRPSPMAASTTQDERGDFVYYVSPERFNADLPLVSILTEYDEIPMTATKLTPEQPEPPVEEPAEPPVEEPVEEPEVPAQTPEQPAETPATNPEQSSDSVAKDTSLLNLVDVNFAEATRRYGASTFYNDMGYYYFADFNIGLAYAYGKDAGCNYVECTLNKILPYCTNMSASTLRRSLGGGQEFYDEMESVTAFAWEYKGCVVVIYKQLNGQYGPDSLVTYNCASRVEDLLNSASPSTQLNFFDLLGKTQSEMESMLGHTLTYNSGYGGLESLVPNKHTLAYTDGANGSGKCIGFFATLENILPNCPASMSQSQLENTFGKYYNHSWSDIEGFHTVYKGYRLFISSTGSYSRTYTPNCAVSVIPLNRDVVKNAQRLWQGYNSEHWAKMTVTERTASTLVCDLEFVQRGGNERGAYMDTVTLTSTDGITYTAKGVEDSWRSTLDLTIVFDKSSARVFTDYIELDGMANYRFETDFLVFQKG